MSRFSPEDVRRMKEKVDKLIADAPKDISDDEEFNDKFNKDIAAFDETLAKMDKTKGQGNAQAANDKIVGDDEDVAPAKSEGKQPVLGSAAPELKLPVRPKTPRGRSPSPSKNTGGN